MVGQIEQSEKIYELFGREKIDPEGRKILAFAILTETHMAPPIWVGKPEQDPFAVEGESNEIRMARFYASKIIPGYQPDLIPRHLNVDRDTPVEIREFRYKESLDPEYINRTLAVMLAKLLPEANLSNCSALCLRGESRALGQTRFGIVVS